MDDASKTALTKYKKTLAGDATKAEDAYNKADAEDKNTKSKANKKSVSTDTKATKTAKGKWDTCAKKMDTAAGKAAAPHKATPDKACQASLLDWKKAEAKEASAKTVVTKTPEGCATNNAEACLSADNKKALAKKKKADDTAGSSVEKKYTDAKGRDAKNKVHKAQASAEKKAKATLDTKEKAWKKCSDAVKKTAADKKPKADLGFLKITGTCQTDLLDYLEAKDAYAEEQAVAKKTPFVKKPVTKVYTLPAGATYCAEPEKKPASCLTKAIKATLAD